MYNYDRSDCRAENENDIQYENQQLKIVEETENKLEGTKDINRRIELLKILVNALDNLSITDSADQDKYQKYQTELKELEEQQAQERKNDDYER